MTARQTAHRLRLLGALLASALVLSSCSRGVNEAELLASAKTYVEKQDFGAAIIQLKAALQKNPQSSQARLLLGLALLDSGDAPAAAIELRKALELGASATQVQPPLARALLAQNQPQQVLQEFAAIKLDNAEASADLKTSVATAYAALRQRDKALETVLSALQDSPQHAAALLLHARIKAADGDLPGALALVDQVLATNSQHLGALLFNGHLQREGNRDRDAALISYTKAAAAHPQAVQAHAAIIEIYLEKRDIESARTRYEQLKKVQPKHPETLLFEAQFANIDKDFLRTRELIEELLRVNPDELRTLQLAGINELQLNSLTRAEAYLSRLMKLTPEAPLPRQLLARIYTRTGRPDKALEVLQPLIGSASADSDSLTLAGEALLQTTDIARAEAIFTRAAKINPLAATARAALALGQVTRGNTAAGIKELEAVAAADSGTQANLALIAARLRTKDIQGTLKAIDELEKKKPDSPVAPMLRGTVLMQEMDTAGAVASFQKALKIDPLYYAATAALASVEMAAGRPDGARKLFEDVLKIDPRNSLALVGLAELKARTGGSKDEVTAAITRAIDANPQEPGPWLLLINHLLSSREPKAALTAAQGAASALPNDLSVMNALGTAQLAAGETQQALATFGRSVTAHPKSVQSNLLLAEAHLAVKDYGRARQALERILGVDPRNLQAQRALITIAIMEKRTPEALAVARSIQQQRPKESIGYLAEAEIHVSQQRSDLALTALKTAYERRPETETAVRYHRMLQREGRLQEAARVAAAWRHDHPKDMVFITYLGIAAMNRNEFAQAEQLFRTALESIPNDASALNNLAYALVRQGKPESLTHATRANELLPEDPSVLDTLAAALGLANRLPEAVQLQQKAVSLSKDAPNYRLHLAELLIQAGERDAAKAELESLRRLGGRFDRQAEVTTLLARL